MQHRIWSVWITAAAALGCSAGTVASQSPSPSRSGPVCDSLRARLTTGDSSIVVQGPFLRSLMLPPDDPPPDLAGQQFTIRIQVDATGRGTVDTLSLPRTTNRGYHLRLVKQLNGNRFSPAVAEGCAVPGVYAFNLRL